jgi:hypothetical protein
MSIIKSSTKKSKSSNYSPKKDKSLLFTTLAVLGLFVGLLLILSLYSVTLISFYTITKLLVGFAISGFLIPLKYYQKWFNFIKYEMIVFNVIGVSPFFTAILLLLNFLIPLSTIVQDYKIDKIYFDDGKFMGVVLENNTYANEERIVEFSDRNPNSVKYKSFLRLTLNKGIFGFEVVSERELIN